jgi:hypothetical protein
LKELEQENAKLKRLVSDLSLEKLVLKDIASGNYLQASVLFPPAIVRLFSDPAFPASYRGRLAVRNRDLNLPQQTHNLLRRMLRSFGHAPLLFVQSFPSELV